jgi:Zn-finger protein
MKEKKRVKEFNSPEVEERKRGRPRLHQVQVMVEAVPYSRKKVLDPLIRKIEVKDAQVRYSDSFESEYQQALVNFVDISSNRSSSLAQEEITEVCHSQWPFYYSKSNETVKSQLFNVSLGLKGIKSDSMLKSMLSSQKSSPVITMLYDDFPPTFYTAQQGLATPFISGAKQNALFATHTITSFSYITEIFGVISTTRDLDLMHDSHSIYPAVCAAKGVHKDISPLAKLILEKSSSSPLGKLLLEKSPLLGSLKLGTPVGSPVLSTGKISPTRDVQMTIMDSTPVRNENTFRSPSKTTKIGTTRNQSEFTIAPPFVFKLPTMSDNLWIDAREFSTNDGRSVRSVCKSCNNNNANAVLKLVVLKSLTDIKKSDPSISEIQSVDDLSDKQMSDLDKVHLCIFSTKPIQPGGEIILSSDDNILYYPCACAKNNCDSLENAFILDNFNRSRFRGILKINQTIQISQSILYLKP